MSWNENDIPDLTGRTAVVTGGNGGLGLQTVRALAEHGATVVMAARNAEKATAAVTFVRKTAPSADIDVVGLDLASMDSVRAAADRIADAHPSVDLLVNNAGVMAISEQRTVDGFEMQFAVNHLGHFVLTARLLPALSATARVVSVSSTAHHMGRPVDPDNPHLHGTYRPWKAYGQSKLANYHFGIGLQQRLSAAGSTIASVLAHPGLSNTDLQATSSAGSGGGRSQKFSETIASLTGMTAAQGALSQLRAATDPAAKGGEFYGPLWVNNGPPVRKPILRQFHLTEAIDSLWRISERETGETFDVAALIKNGLR